MRLRSDYHYHLPSEQIAQVPADRRDAAQLLFLEPSPVGIAYRDRSIADLAELIPAGAVVVVNDTRVVPARVFAQKPTGGQVELLFVEPVAADGDDGGNGELGAAVRERVPERWRCLAKSSKGLRAGLSLTVRERDGGPIPKVQLSDATLTVVRERQPGSNDATIEVALPPAWPDGMAFLERFGHVPLPPYIERQHGVSAADRTRYQTVFARVPGAVAAPTAGLHFTEDAIAALKARGVHMAPLTLHVGLGTFAPMRADHIDDHRMHRERYHIPDETAALVASGRPVVAVGTTCVRALESAAVAGGGRVLPGAGSTDLFITPGFRFQVTDWLLTNFHLPESTLLMMVCAFAGYREIMDAYAHAVAARYRFFSYGDAMLIARKPVGAPAAAAHDQGEVSDR